MSKFLHLHEDVMSKSDNQTAITFSCMHQGTNYSRKISIIQSVKKIPFQIMCHRQRGLFLFLSFLNSSLRDNGTEASFHNFTNTSKKVSSYNDRFATISLIIIRFCCFPQSNF